MVAIVEATTLPLIQASAKQSEWTAWVNAVVVDSKLADMANGAYVRGLWYLSYVLPRGQGAVGQAIANTLFSNAGSKTVAIAGLGSVMLGSHRQDLQNLGHKIHWNYRMEPLGPDAIQCIVEPLALTSFDPVLAEASTHRHKKGKGSGGNKARKSEVTTFSTASSAPSSSLEGEESEMVRRELKPLFLLLIPGAHKGDQEYLEQLHLAYLRKRCPFDLQEEWAPFLWERAINQEEVRELGTWSYVYKEKKSEEEFDIPAQPAARPGSSSTTKPPAQPQDTSESPFQPVLSKAFLCLPNIEGIHRSLVARLNAPPLSAEGTEEEKQREEVAA